MDELARDPREASHAARSRDDGRPAPLDDAGRPADDAVIAIATADADADADADEAATAEPDRTHGLRCIRCGYALVGLPTHGDCPECGTSIELSLAGDRIANADPRWLDLITRGLGLLHLGIAAASVTWGALLGLTVVTTLLAGIGGPNWRPAVWVLVGPILTYAGLAGLMVAGVGGALVTATEPRDADQEALVSVRPVARWGTMAAVAFGGLAFAANAGLPAPSGRIAALALVVLAAAAAGHGLAALHAWFRQLAGRVPSGPLADRCTADAAWFRSRTRYALMGLTALITIDVLPAFGVALGPFAAGSRIHRLMTFGVLFVGVSAVFKAAGLVRLARDLRGAVIQAGRASPRPRA